MIKSPAFLFAAIWSYLAHSWPGLKCVKQNIKQLEIDKHIIITFPVQQHLTFLEDLFLVFVFRFSCYIQFSKFTWK